MSDSKIPMWRLVLPHMHPEGRRFALPALLIAVLLSVLYPPLAFPSVALAYGVYLFFRDPERVVPNNPNLLVSPADGTVCMVSLVPMPSLLQAGYEPVWRVCVFMSVLDVHVNRMPATAAIERSRYVPGKFLNASLDKASEDNERHLYLMRTPQGVGFAVVQIAGLVARRIVSFVTEGDTLERGERFGVIRFGSRVDVYLPPGVEPLVSVGQTMVAGETPLARIEAIECEQRKTFDEKTQNTETA